MNNTLDDVSCLLHLHITICILDHIEVSYTKKEIRGQWKLELGIMADQKAYVVMFAGNRLLERIYCIFSAVPYLPTRARCIYTRVGTNTWLYLPKRVLRQFGYVPRIPLERLAYEKCSEAWGEWKQHVVLLG
ncbi:hypothetical protein GmHk_01G000761 [Glycine max]|nr:hypothetical protein GmHk_01G000761 [Glycine max]